MNNLNIPIYRAKKIDSDEYIEGQLVIDSVGQTIIIQDCIIYGDFKADNVWQQGVYNSFNFIVDPSTLSINFTDMIDSQGNKIFASLSEDGKGGDIVKIRDIDFKYVYKYIKGKFMLDSMELMNPYLLFEKIGIQE